MYKLKTVVIVLFVLIAVHWVYSQEVTTGTITGKIADEKGDPLPGATITVTSEKGVSKTVISDIDGVFRIPFLTPGTYSLKAEMENFKTFQKTNILVPLNAKIDVGMITMQLGGTAEVVEVIGNPVVDLTSTSAGTNISEQLMKSVPVGRTFASTLFLAPGVAGSGVGGNNPSVSGASGLENSYIIDGVNITNAGYGSLGAYSIVFGSLGSGINFDYVKEVQLKAGGVEAEYGHALGGVINVITKSGGNTFDGDVFAYAQPGALEGERTLIHTESGFVNLVEYQQWDVGFDAGGKIIKDKLFWFAAFDPQENKLTRQAPDNVDESGNYVFPLRAILPDGKDSVTRRIYNYAGKLTYNLNADNIIEFSIFGDPTKGAYGLQRGGSFLREELETGKEELDLGGHNQVVRWTSILSPSWFLEAQLANHQDKFDEVGYKDVESIIDLRTLPYHYPGGLGFVGKDKSTNLQLSVKLTNIFKTHEFKYGIAYEKIGYDHTTNYTGPTRCFKYFDAETGDLKEACTVTGNIVRIRRRSYGDVFDLRRNRVGQNTVSTKSDYFNFFVQDSWSLTPHVNIKLGIRYERQYLSGGGEGANDKTLSNNWAPRVGASWDFMKDGKSKLFAFWGRYFEKIPNDAAVRSLSVEKSLALAFVDPTFSTAPLDWFNVFQNLDNFFYAVEYGYEPTVWEKDLKSMYQDEFVVGVEREIMAGLNVSSRFIYRKIGRIIEDIQLNRYSDIFCGTEQTDPNCTPGIDFGNFFVANVSTKYPGMPDPIRNYKALELVVNKRMSENWQMMASWRIAKLSGNYEGLFNNDNGQSDPNITSKFDFPYLNDRIFWGPTGDEGVLPTDRRHIFRIYGSYSFNMGLNIGLGLDAQSGIPISKLGCAELYGCSERLLAPRGSEGRTDWRFNIDLHADYTFKVAEGQSLTLLVDIFNVPSSNTVTGVDMDYEDEVGVLNPAYLSPSSYQTPRQIRFGVRYTF